MPVYPEMRGKVALVTGVNTAVGLATARAFLRQGVRAVVITGGTVQQGEAAEKALAKYGKARWHDVEITDSKAVRRLLNGIRSGFRRLDYAFNNCGRGARDKWVGPTKVAHWRGTIDSYLTSTFLLMTSELHAMARTRFHHPEDTCVMVNNASVAAPRDYLFGHGAPYTAAMYGVIALTRVTAAQCSIAGPRIFGICPSWIRMAVRYKHLAAARRKKPQMGPMGTPAEIASTVVWLCSEAASSIAIGTVLGIDTTHA